MRRKRMRRWLDSGEDCGNEEGRNGTTLSPKIDTKSSYKEDTFRWNFGRLLVSNAKYIKTRVLALQDTILYHDCHNAVNLRRGRRTGA